MLRQFLFLLGVCELEVSNPSSLSSDELEVQSSSWTKETLKTNKQKTFSKKKAIWPQFPDEIFPNPLNFPHKDIFFFKISWVVPVNYMSRNLCKKWTMLALSLLLFKQLFAYQDWNENENLTISLLSLQVENALCRKITHVEVQFR